MFLANMCINKWRLLRERYSKEKRKYEKRTPQKLFDKWCYYDSLNFLDDFIKPRKPRFNVKDSLNESLMSNLFQQDSAPEEEEITIIKVDPSNSCFDIDNEAHTIYIRGSTEDMMKEEQEEDVFDRKKIRKITNSPNTNSKGSNVSQTNVVSSTPCTSRTHVTENDGVSYLDEDELFGQAIAAELKSMPRGRKKMKLKADIYKLLCDFEYEDE